MKKALEGYFKAMGIDDKMRETGVLSQWGQLMGEAVDKRTTAKYIRDGVLYLEINSSVMRDELLQSKTDIIEKLNTAAGIEIIKDIFFK